MVKYLEIPWLIDVYNLRLRCANVIDKTVTKVCVSSVRESKGNLGNNTFVVVSFISYIAVIDNGQPCIYWTYSRALKWNSLVLSFASTFKSIWAPTPLRSHWYTYLKNKSFLSSDAPHLSHDDAIKWIHFPRNWPFVRGIHRSRWIPHTKASDAEIWCFLWSASE